MPELVEGGGKGTANVDGTLYNAQIELTEWYMNPCNSKEQWHTYNDYVYIRATYSHDTLTCT